LALAPNLTDLAPRLKPASTQWRNNADVPSVLDNLEKRLARWWPNTVAQLQQSPRTLAACVRIDRHSALRGLEGVLFLMFVRFADLIGSL
jgi:hypothetical protein